tara:strand:+ start:259 stop:459 length:201 start_codon:yes stop_codon:yes gene_type:complete
MTNTSPMCSGAVKIDASCAARGTMFKFGYEKLPHSDGQLHLTRDEILAKRLGNMFWALFSQKSDLK